jgi:cell division cycle 14
VWRAKELGWVCFKDGGFNLEDYEHLDCPLNADLHEVVPGKFIAMRGPRSLPDGAHFKDTPSGARNFSPAHYADILHQFDVSLVVRLNEAEYDSAEFEAEGIAVAALPFPDCSTPPPDVVAQFLAIADAVPGALAVHCKAGLGRTGPLIALYMMRRHGFTARAAMGWLRVVRPGSVIGEQQHFLCRQEAIMRAVAPGPSRLPPAKAGSSAEGFTAADVGALAAAAAASAPEFLRKKGPRPESAGVVQEVEEQALVAHVASAGRRRDRRRLRADRRHESLPSFPSEMDPAEP